MLTAQQVLIAALDLTTAGDSLARVRGVRANGTKLVLDLAGVNFMDSTGLAALIKAIGEARRAACPIELTPRFSPQVERLFEITGAYQTVCP